MSIFRRIGPGTDNRLADDRWPKHSIDQKQQAELRVLRIDLLGTLKDQEPLKDINSRLTEFFAGDTLKVADEFKAAQSINDSPARTLLEKIGLGKLNGNSSSRHRA